MWVETNNNLVKIISSKDIIIQANKPKSHKMMKDSCDILKKKKVKCQDRHGPKSEKCLRYQFEEKRCLSFLHCAREAKDYYTTLDEEKGLCASFDEVHCFGNPRLMKIDFRGGNNSSSQINEKIFEQHLKAKRKVQNNRQRFRDCQRISFKLNRCLQKSGIS